MSVTEQDRERAAKLLGESTIGDHINRKMAIPRIAAALADERDRARAELHAKIVETTGTHDCPVCNAGRPLRDGATCPLCEGWTTL